MRVDPDLSRRIEHLAVRPDAFRHGIHGAVAARVCDVDAVCAVSLHKFGLLRD